MTQTARKIELKTAGQEVFMTVQSCEKWKVGEMKFPEAKWVGTDGNGHLIAVHMPWSSAERQLDRLNKSMESIAGCTVKISRDPNPGGAAWWGVNFADLGDEDEIPDATARDVEALRAGNAGPGLDEQAPHPATRGSGSQSSQAPTNAPHVPPGVNPAYDQYLDITRFVLTRVVPLFERESDRAVEDVAIAAMVNTLFINLKRGY
jgi:hypothetical protein